MIDREEPRKICQGCLTGNYWLCDSFPGKAPEHVKREIEYRQYKAKRLKHADRLKEEEENLPRSERVFVRGV